MIQTHPNFIISLYISNFVAFDTVRHLLLCEALNYLDLYDKLLLFFSLPEHFSKLSSSILSTNFHPKILSSLLVISFSRNDLNMQRYLILNMFKQEYMVLILNSSLSTFFTVTIETIIVSSDSSPKSCHFQHLLSTYLSSPVTYLVL